MVQDRPDRIDIGLRSHLGRPSVGLLGRHVGRSAQHVPLAGQLRHLGRALGLAQLAEGPGRGLPTLVLARIEHPRQPPVHHVHLAEAPDHDVGRLQVAVHHALRVGVGHGLAHPVDHAHGARRVPALLAPLDQPEDGLQVATLDELHREVHVAARARAQVVHRDDAWVVELAGDLRLLEEASERAVRVGSPAPPCALDLHGQRPVQVLVPDLQDHAHAPARELALDPIALVWRAPAGDALDDRLGGRGRGPGLGREGASRGRRDPLLQGGAPPRVFPQQKLQLAEELGVLGLDVAQELRPRGALEGRGALEHLLQAFEAGHGRDSRQAFYAERVSG